MQQRLSAVGFTQHGCVEDWDCPRG